MKPCSKTEKRPLNTVSQMFAELSEATRERLTIDLSGFNLVLVPVAVK